jgi:predicted nucleic acid-binding protein
MGLIEKLRGKTVYLDTAPLVYYIEKNSLLFNSAEKLFSAHLNGEFLFLTSVLTLSEVLAQPAEKRRDDLRNQYELILTSSPNLTLLEVGVHEARIAASLKAQFKLGLPDALHLATAIENNADYFLTNDKRIPKTVPIELILLSDV